MDNRSKIYNQGQKILVNAQDSSAMPEYVSESEKPNYIGAGWAFPLAVNVQGGVQVSAAEPNIEESIFIILRTDLGERVYRPDFGSRLSELVFEPLNTRTLLLIKLYIEEALSRWEPRIILKEVRTDPDPIRGKVDIEIIYQSKDSPDIRSFVFPFYLSNQLEDANQFYFADNK